MIKNMKITKVKKSSKGSNYIGVYKCSKTGHYYSKNYRNKRCYTSKLFKKEIDAAEKYDAFTLKYNPSCKKINFPIKKYNKSIKNKIILNKKNFISKRPRIPEFIKIIVYSRQDDKCTLCTGSLGIGRIIDHIIPRSLGGLDNINNYQAICGTCNKWKTYRFDHIIKNYLKNNKKVNLDTILQLQKVEFTKFNGPYIA